MLRRETSYRWEEQTTLFLRRSTGKYILVKYLTSSLDILLTYPEELYRKMLEAQKLKPVLLVTRNRKHLWMFDGDLYWTDDNLSAEDAHALLAERKAKQRKRVERAQRFIDLADVDAEAAAIARREPIPDDVKIFVWQRDSGSCVSCGSKERLEFDHIIPVTMGGSDTARNLQLLCEVCNRAKGGNLS